MKEDNLEEGNVGMKKRLIMAGIILFLFSLMACGRLDENAHIPGEPDIMSSIRSNNDEHLTIIANRDEIDDKFEFAQLLVKMCQENSFKSIKFSTDFGYATSLDMRVYLWKDEIEGHEPVMTVEFRPIDWNMGYDIVNHPEMFELIVDGEKVE